MSAVCLRQINTATFRAPSDNMDGSSYMIRIDLLGFREISSAHKDAAHLFSEFVQALRSSRVVCLTVERLVFTPALATLIIETPIVVNQLSIYGDGCAELTPTQFRDVSLHCSPSFLRVSACRLRACQISDDLVRALAKNRVLRTSFPDIAPVDGGTFAVTDDSIVDFCMQSDVQIGQEGDAPMQKPFGELYLYNGRFTKALFKRLIEASSASTRTQPLRIIVSRLQLDDEDLRDFVQHLSYGQHLGRPLRIYNFLDEQHGADAAMHLQIVLHPDDRLEMIRGRRPCPYFR